MRCDELQPNMARHGLLLRPGPCSALDSTQLDGSAKRGGQAHLRFNGALAPLV